MIKNYPNAEYQKSNQINNVLVEKLTNLAVIGLHDMYIDDQLEFAFKKKLTDRGFVLEGQNIRYTLINLIGLYKAECNGFDIKIDLKKVIRNKIKNADKLEGVGEIGLLLWATSLISVEDLLKILTKINFQSILENYKDAEMKLTMELSWLMIGLLMASTFSPVFKKSIGNLPEKLYELTRNNYGGSGIFGHQDSSNFSGRFRGNIGSFADQVYPIYAFSLFSKLRDNEEASLIASECADTLCEHQGDNGEWLWHYDSRDGSLISKYPIYSVHQDAMAPMALFAVQKCTGKNYEDNIYKGLDWLINNPENASMIDEENNMIWRAIGPSTAHRKFKSTLAQLGFNTNEEYSSVEVTKECWSYHLGWLLHAFAGRGKRDKNQKEMDNFRLKDLKLYNIK